MKGRRVVRAENYHGVDLFVIPAARGDPSKAEETAGKDVSTGTRSTDGVGKLRFGGGAGDGR